jgi:hypothetical protein
MIVRPIDFAGNYISEKDIVALDLIDSGIGILF